MKIKQVVWQQILGLLPGEISSNEVDWLISPRHHMPLLQQRRAKMIINRVRLFAALFAVLTPLWIVVDVMSLPFPLWLELGGMRLLVTLAFSALVLWNPAKMQLYAAYRGMATLFAIPTFFYVASHLTLTRYHLMGISAALGTGYAFLPFVLLAGFAIFPLALAESITFAAPVLVAYAMAGMLNWDIFNWPSFSGEFWLLSLLIGVASMASMSQLAFIIALNNQAMRDPLTSAFSRRSGEEMLQWQVESANKQGSPLSLVFFDIDHFKAVNDQFGHEAGDDVIRQLYQEVTLYLGKVGNRNDQLIRWGGEEFIIIMSATNKSLAVSLLKQLQINGMGARPDNQPLTISIGVAELSEMAEADWKALVDKADFRMYKAKQAGRNRIVSQDETEAI